jgi:ATP-binding cassette subfamily C (CFTR/MRP) protein 1
MFFPIRQVSLVTFATYILSDERNILDATTAFVSLALFQILKFPMALLPYLVAAFVQVSAASSNNGIHLQDGLTNKRLVFT